MQDYDRLKVGKYFDCENNAEEIVGFLNRGGMVVFECMSRGRRAEPYYLKIMAAQDGLDIQAFPKQ